MTRGLALCLALGVAGGAASAQVRDSDRPEPLACRPAGEGPFAVVIWNHGLVTDRATFSNAQRGWQNICRDLAAEGYLAYVPIRPLVRNLGPTEITREADQLSKTVSGIIAMPDVDRGRVALMGHSRGATLALMLAVRRRDLAALILTAPAPIPARFLDGTMERVRTMATPVLLMVEEGDERGALPAVADIDAELTRRRKDDHRTLRYDRGGGHFLFIRKDYWWDDLRAFLHEKLKRP